MCIVIIAIKKYNSDTGPLFTETAVKGKRHYLHNERQQRKSEENETVKKGKIGVTSTNLTHANRKCRSCYIHDFFKKIASAYQYIETSHVLVLPHKTAKGRQRCRVVRSVVFTTAKIARVMVELPPKPRCCVLGYDALRQLSLLGGI